MEDDAVNDRSRGAGGGGSLLDRLRAHLREGGVPFREISHGPAARAEDYSRELGTRLQEQAKCLLVRLRYENPTSREYVLVAVPAQKRVDLELVARTAGSASARLADRNQLRVVTGCDFGELPPLGRPMGLRLLMDRELVAEPEIYFNAGRLDVSMAAPPGDIAELEQAILF